MTIELAPELEAEVTKYSAAKGIDPKEFVEKALVDAVASERAAIMPEKKEDIRVFLDRLAGTSPPVNAHLTETFTRETIYADDDEKFQL
jgi:hypothetical protein